MDSPMPSPGSVTPDLTAYVSVWDIRKKYKNVLLQVTMFILIMELVERLSFYGINQGLMNFMTKHVGWSRVTASALKSTWMSLCNLSSLFGAYLADERWGRYRVILVFGIWYFIGEVLVAISAHPSMENDKSIMAPLFAIGWFVGMGFGSGVIKSNVVTFGADQFNPNDDREVKQKEAFFSYFYMCINVGATIAYGYLSVVCVDGGGFISREYGYFGVFTICAIIMGVAVCSLVLGKSRYVHGHPTDHAVSTLFRVVVSVAKYHIKGAILLYGSLLMLTSIFLNIAAAATSKHEGLSQILAYLSAFAVFVGICSLLVCGLDTTFADGARKSTGGVFDDRQVEGYKALVRILPFLAFTIIWDCIAGQADANFQTITQQCDLRLHPSDPASSQIPGPAVGVFSCVIIVIAIPVLDTCVYPLYSKIAGKSPSYFGRMATGLVLATVGVVWTGVFEIIRRNSGPLMHNGSPIVDNGSGLPMNHIYWAAAIPNYVFLGLAECFINVGAMDCCYASVPVHLKSTAQALNLLMVSMGTSLTSAFTIMFAKYSPSDDLNEGNLEIMYFAMGVLGLLNLAGFVVIMRKMNFGMHDSPKYVEADITQTE